MTPTQHLDRRDAAIAAFASAVDQIAEQTFTVACTQPACLHFARIASKALDAYVCGSTTVCACHPAAALALGVEALPCGGKS